MFPPPQHCQQHPSIRAVPQIWSYQPPAASHEIAVSPRHGAQSQPQPLLLDGCMSPPGHWGGRGTHLHPKPSHRPPAHPGQGTHLPRIFHQHRLQSSQGEGRDWCNSPTASKFLLHILKIVQKIQFCPAPSENAVALPSIGGPTPPPL